MMTGIGFIVLAVIIVWATYALVSIFDGEHLLTMLAVLLGVILVERGVKIIDHSIGVPVEAETSITPDP